MPVSIHLDIGERAMRSEFHELDVRKPYSIRRQSFYLAGNGNQITSSSQIRRRSNILVAARTIFAEDGAAAVTVRELVNRSGNTAPTIYKLVGNRDSVIEQALIECLFACIQKSEEIAKKYIIDYVSALIEVFWYSTKMQPSYSRNQIKMLYGVDGNRRVALMFRTILIETLSIYLAGMCLPERKLNATQLNGLAIVLESAIRGFFFDWAEGIMNIHLLHQRLTESVAVTLEGFVRFSDRNTISDWRARMGQEVL